MQEMQPLLKNEMVVSEIKVDSRILVLYVFCLILLIEIFLDRRFAMK